jgi:hypothetical protein
VRGTRQEPARTGRGAIPCKVRAVAAKVFMIRNMHGMISAAMEMSDRVQASSVHKFERCGLPPPEP